MATLDEIHYIFVEMQRRWTVPWIETEQREVFQ